MANKNSLGMLRQYTLPTFHEGKRCYVDFYSFDPILGDMKRKKYYLPNGLTKTECKRRAHDIIALLTLKLNDGWNPWVADSDKNKFTEIEDALNRYDSHLERYDRAKTRNNYSSRLTIFREYLKLHPIHYTYQIDKAYCIGFLDYILIERDCSNRTRNNYKGWLSSLCEWMQERGYIDDNPTSDIPKLRNEVKKRVPLTDKMLSTLTSYLRTNDKNMLLACMMEYYTFIRPSELSRIKIGDISIETQSIFVDSEISKNRRDDNVAINKSIIELMIELNLFSYSSECYIFSHNLMPGREYVGPDQFNKRWKIHREKLKWSDIYQFYSLKDSGIRDLANSKGIVIARDQARHTDISTTNKYLSGKNKRPHKEAQEFVGNM